MKYLKTYELYNKTDIKKYTVYIHENKDYYIDQIIDNKNGYIVYIMLYKYNSDTNDFCDTDVSDSKSKSEINKYLINVLFSSDNIFECKDFLKLYANSKKYNL